MGERFLLSEQEQKLYGGYLLLRFSVHAMLVRNGLEKCKVKAISLSNANDIPAEILTKMTFPIEEKEFGSTEYYFQDYKTACANVDYETVLPFLRTE